MFPSGAPREHTSLQLSYPCCILRATYLAASMCFGRVAAVISANGQVPAQPRFLLRRWDSLRATSFLRAHSQRSRIEKKSRRTSGMGRLRPVSADLSSLINTSAVITFDRNCDHVGPARAAGMGPNSLRVNRLFGVRVPERTFAVGLGHPNAIAYRKQLSGAV